MPRLPLECIEAIVWHTCDLPTLRSLLTVNHAVFRVAARRLWHNPLETVAQTSDWGLSFERLAKTIFYHFSPAALPPPPRLPITFPNQARNILTGYFALDQPTNTAATAALKQPTLDYFSMIRALVDSPVVLSLALKSGPPAEALSLNLDVGYPAACCYYHDEVIWTICRDHRRMQRLTMLQIPLWRWNVDRYINAIPQMKQLRHVVFDARYAINGEVDDDSVANEFIQRALGFIREFVRHHGDRQLHQVEFLTGQYESSNQEEFQTLVGLLKDLIPCCRAPSILGPFNWNDCLQNLAVLDLGHVRSIAVNKRLALSEANARGTDTSLLALLVVDLKYPDGDLSDAVCTILRAFGASLQSVVVQGASQGDMYNVYRGGRPGVVISTNFVGLPQLKKLCIDTMDQLEFSPQAFHHCPLLQSLSLTDRSYARSTWITRQDTWAMPMLRELVLQGSVAMTFNPLSLSSMPNLETLDLASEREWGYFFGCTFDSMEYREEEDDEAMPGRARPRVMRGWTWDWPCPQLTVLRLRGEFAARIRFKWLACCPRLQELQVYLGLRHHHSVDLDDEQYPPLEEEECNSGIIVEEQDLSVSSLSSPSASSVQEQVSRSFVLPDLRSVRLDGRWHLSDRACDQLLHGVAPRLVELILYYCSTRPSIERLVKHGERHPYLRQVSLADFTFHQQEELLTAGLTNAEFGFDSPGEVGPLSDIFSLPSKAESAVQSPLGHDARDSFCCYDINFDTYRYRPPISSTP
ncbi:hypothetical protein DFQ27_001346 [Actinomortierella ambigua]|uniref:F-box domain-containing protein n=1 Tax=Actinomortierella ambigua TaxID=1343610 RepID=A0A9P6U7R4_9FUNG|nr:hypothetical protein DFQ27_001346 [Actinomortierella ambigua]